MNIQALISRSTEMDLGLVLLADDFRVSYCDYSLKLGKRFYVEFRLEFYYFFCFAFSLLHSTHARFKSSIFRLEVSLLFLSCHEENCGYICVLFLEGFSLFSR